MSSAPKEEAAKPGNFLRAVIERDLEAGSYAARRFAGSPGDAAHHAAGPADPARIRTRFPPEPNGYLHVGHAKSIWLNFSLAQQYGGVCHLRFDDTNPEKEEQEYVDAIVEMVHWLGYDWRASYDGATVEHLYYASDYFDFMYRAAEALIEAGHAYVDEQSADEMRVNRGDFATPGTESPFRGRSPAENLARLREMRDGHHADGAMVLRAKIDMASPNINLRDPTLYRIKRATHHNTGDRWCIYPMYTYAHPLEDALENITHSICTLEFEDQRPFYDWVLERLAECGLLAQPLPKQYEFARLNLTYIVTSKRKLRQMVEEGIVDGWDDPRLPTLVGMRRRGYTPESLRLLAERSGVSKAGGWIDYSFLDIALRDDLDTKAPRAMAVLDPLKLVLSNWDAVIGKGQTLPCSAPLHPGQPERGARRFTLGPEVWIEREDFMEEPLKGYHRLSPPRFDGKGAQIARQRGAAEVRLHHPVHGAEEELRRYSGGSAGHAGTRHAQRHARGRRRQDQGRAHLGGGARRAAGRSAAVRPAVHRSPARRRRTRLQELPEPRQQEGGARLARTFTGHGPCRRQVPVRAPRLLRRRSQGLCGFGRRCSTASPR